jgi:hypothetical protein
VASTKLLPIVKNEEAANSRDLFTFSCVPGGFDGKRLLFFVYPVLLIAACTTSKTPTAPTSAPSAVSGALAHVGHGAAVAGTASADDPNSAAHDDKGYIDGWFNGEDVQLYYHRERNHQGLSNELIELPPDQERVGRIRRRSRPGGLLNCYARAA